MRRQRYEEPQGVHASKRGTSLPRWLAVVTAVLLAAVLIPAAARAEEADLDEPVVRVASASRMQSAAATAPTVATESGIHGDKLSLEQLTNLWMSLPTEPTGDAIYSTATDSDAYTPAVLSDESLAYGESYINFMRRQAGLGTIALDATLNQNAAQGALILTRLDKGLTHSPATPDGVTDEQAKPGKYACATSNLSATWQGDEVLREAIQLQMNDSSSGNIPMVGHRRWLLNPGVQKMGIGSSYRSGDDFTYTAVRVFDNRYSAYYDSAYGSTATSNGTADYDFVAWPASGPMLRTVFTPGTPWSVVLNPGEYATPDADSVVVTVTRQSDGKSWTLSGSSPDDGYFAINTDGYGYGPAIIFAPDYPSQSNIPSYDGTYHVDVTGLQTTSGSAATLSYDVDFSGISFDNMDLDVSVEDATYTGQELTPAVTVKAGPTTLTRGTDYNVSYSDNVNAGTGTVTITGMGSYTGTKTATFSIAQKPLASSMAEAIPDQAYTGDACNPKPVLKDGGTTLREGVDYQVDYGANVDAGKCSLTVTGMGNSGGTLQVPYTIKKASIGDASAAAVPDQTYTGSPIAPSPTLSYNGRTLAEGTDYSLAYSNNTAAGTATIIITGKKNFEGTKAVAFHITPADISGAKVSPIAGQTYTGGELRPDVTVTLAGKTLAAGVDYTVAYSDNTNAGTAKATVTGTGNYTGSVAANFRIRPADISKAAISPIPDQAYTGQAATPDVTVTLGDRTLAAGTDYSVAYQNNKGIGTAKATVTGTGNYTGSLAASFKIVAADIVDTDVYIPHQTYTGEKIEPSVTVTLDGKTLTAGTDYTVTYSDNIDVGTASVVITGQGIFTGTKTSTFQIMPASISDADIAAIPDQPYTGSAVEPAVALSLGKSDLEEGTDYVVEYADNVEPGTATVSVTGTGNYAGTATASFRIVAANVPMYRLYNQWSGEHLFTESRDEYDQLVAIGWNGEGVAWMAPERSATPIYRLYNQWSGDHHYTSSRDEYDQLVSIGWSGEGVKAYSDDGRAHPVYRLFNRWLTQGTHLYTTDESEYRQLGSIGWDPEGTAFYASALPDGQGE